MTYKKEMYLLILSFVLVTSLYIIIQAVQSEDYSALINLINGAGIILLANSFKEKEKQ